MHRNRRRGVSIALATLTLTAVHAQQAPFRSAVVLQTIDITISTRQGEPVTNIAPSDLNATIGGQPRRIVSVEFVGAGAAPASRVAPIDPASRSATNRTPDRRVDVSRTPVTLAFFMDHQSFRAGEALPIMVAAQEFVRNVPADEYGVASTWSGGVLSITSDRSQVLPQIVGLAGGAGSIGDGTGIQAPTPGLAGGFTRISDGSLSVLEAADPQALVTAVERLCLDDVPGCGNAVVAYAKEVVRFAEEKARQQINALERVLQDLARRPGLKHLVVISRGIVPVGSQFALPSIQRAAGAAGVIVHVLYARPEWDASIKGNSPRRFDDEATGRGTLGVMTAGGGGTFEEVSGQPARAFGRLAVQIRSVYRVGVELQAGDLERSELQVEVRTTRRDLALNGNRRTIPRRPAIGVDSTLTTDQRLDQLLTGRDPDQSLPLAVRTYVSRDPAGAGLLLRMAIRAGSPGPIQSRYMLMTATGQRVSGGVARDRRAEPGEPDTHLLIAQTILPGDYVLHIAGVDGSRAGSIEYRFRARLNRGAHVMFSDPEISDTDSGRLSVDELVVVGGTALVSFELYPAIAADSAPVVVRFDIDGVKTPIAEHRVAQLSADAPTPVATRLSMAGLAPGDYLLRISVTDDGGHDRGTVTRHLKYSPDESPAAAPATGSPRDSRVRASAWTSRQVSFTGFTLTRALERADLPAIIGVLEQRSGPLESSWAPIAASLKRGDIVPGDALPPVGPAAMSRLQGATLAALVHLSAGRIGPATAELHRAVSAAPDFGPALFLLGLCHAAAGRDADAAGAWQMATARPNAPRGVYLEAADAWLRLGRPATAGELVDEARERWPDDKDLLARAALIASFQEDFQRVVDLNTTGGEWPEDVVLVRLSALYELLQRGGAESKLRSVFVEEAGRYLSGEHPNKGIVRAWLDAVDR